MNLIERVYALTTPDLTPTNEGSGGTISDFVEKIIPVITGIAGAIAIIYLIYSGILYLNAAGNPDAAKKGQQGIINAIIGIIVIALAYVIVNAVFGTANTIS